MIIKILLTANFLAIWLYAFSQRRRVHFVTSVMSLLCVTAIYLVWRPDDATELASLVGVGRGTDLLLYCWVVLSLGITLSLHIKLEHQNELITQLARQFALASVQDGKIPNGHLAIPLPPAAELESARPDGHVKTGKDQH